MNKVRTIKEVRGRWSDARRGVYLLKQEILRSYKKDAIGAEMLTRAVLEPFERLLDIIDEPIAQGEDIDFAMSLAGSNNFTAKTYRNKLDVILPAYTRLMAAQGIEVTLTEKRRVIATLVEKGA